MDFFCFVFCETIINSQKSQRNPCQEKRLKAQEPVRNPTQLLTTNHYPSNSMSTHYRYSCIQIYELSHQNKNYATPIPVVVRGCELGGCPRRRLESRPLPGAGGAGGPGHLRELLEGGDGSRVAARHWSWAGGLRRHLRFESALASERARGRRREKFLFCRG